MSASDDKAQIAWQPLTAKGVAAFARASWGRLLLVQLIVALLAAGTLVWFLQRCWFPTVGEAIRKLPAQGELRAGTLNWTGPSPMSLAEGRCLGIAVDLDHTGESRSPAHVQMELGRADFKVYSLFGCGRGAYPHSGTLEFNRSVLWPWWGAWAPAILAIVAGSVVAGLMAIWACLATLYCLPVWLIGFFAKRDCSLAGSWRLAGAALMPGALLMCAAFFMYGWGALDPLRLVVIGALHLVMGWVYVFISPLRLSARPAPAPKDNPFA